MRNIIALFHTAHVINTPGSTARARDCFVSVYIIYLTEQITDGVIEIHPFLQIEGFCHCFQAQIWHLCCLLHFESWKLHHSYRYNQKANSVGFLTSFHIFCALSLCSKPFETETLCNTSELADMGITCNSDLFLSFQRLRFILGQRHIYEPPASIGTQWFDCYPKG